MSGWEWLILTLFTVFIFVDGQLSQSCPLNHTKNGCDGIKQLKLINDIRACCTQCIDRNGTELLSEFAKKCLRDVYVNLLFSKNESKTDRSEWSKFTLVTYSTKNIEDFTTISTAINSVFASINGYDIITTTPENGFEFDAIDQRWNKVKVIEYFISLYLQSNSESHCTEVEKYLVWFDTDLIFLDFGPQFFESVVSRSAAQFDVLPDMLISRDVNPLNGIVNTGCMVVRMTEWSLEFFREWWNYTTHSDGMDQHVFDKIYEQRLAKYRHEKASVTTDSSGQQSSLSLSSNNVEQRIAILDFHELNSHIPASIHQEPHHPILHLAGESSVVRSDIFRRALETVCNTGFVGSSSLINDQDTMSVSSSTDTFRMDNACNCSNSFNVSRLPPQLGISRQVLQSSTNRFAYLIFQNLQRIQTKLLECVADIDVLSNAQDVTCTLPLIIDLRNKLRDTAQSRNVFQQSEGNTVNEWSNEHGAVVTQAMFDVYFLSALRAGFFSQVKAYMSHAYCSSLIHHSLSPVIQRVCDRFHQLFQIFFDQNPTDTGPINDQYWCDLTDGLIVTMSELASLWSVEKRSSSIYDELKYLQNVLDAGFELCVQEETHSYNYYTVLTLMNHILNRIKSLTHLISGPTTNNLHSLGLTSYYEFKLHDFLSIYYRNQRQGRKYDMELQQLRMAYNAWNVMSAQYNFFGTGKAVSEPFKEISKILARMAEIECGYYCVPTNGATTRQECLNGLSNVFKCLNYTGVTWLSRVDHATYRRFLQLWQIDKMNGDGGVDMTDQWVTDEAQVLEPALMDLPADILGELSMYSTIATQCSLHFDRFIIQKDSEVSEPLSSSTPVVTPSRSQTRRYLTNAKFICDVLKKRNESANHCYLPLHWIDLLHDSRSPLDHNPVIPEPVPPIPTQQDAKAQIFGEIHRKNNSFTIKKKLKRRKKSK